MSIDLGSDLTALGAARLSEAIHARQVSCREVMTAHLDRIDERNPALNAIVSLRDRDELLAEAAGLDDELAAGRSRGWLHGIPQAIKDLAETKGLRTTNGSRLLQHWVPDFDDLMVSRMRAAGCVIIGKTNVPEFGLGSNTYNDVFGPTLNPYDTTRTAGGSSGGAAVALATQMLPVADGSDYMGSLRNPAGWNNVFGFRPSQGRVPSWPERDVYIAQLSTEGPMGRSVVDLAALLGTQAGSDPRVPLSIPGRLDELSGVAATRRTLGSLASLDGVRIGWLGDLDGHLAMDPGILDVCGAGLRRLESLGASVEPTLLSMSPDRVWRAWLVWRRLLVSGGLAPLVTDATKRDLMKPEALWEIDHGLALTGPEISRAAGERTAFFGSITSLLRGLGGAASGSTSGSGSFDVLAIPTAQVWPFDVTTHWPQWIGDREMDTYHRWMEVTTYATFAGLPAISVPVGFDERGLPMGMQLIGRPQGDVELLRIAHLYESTIGDLGVGGA